MWAVSLAFGHQTVSNRDLSSKDRPLLDALWEPAIWETSTEVLEPILEVASRMPFFMVTRAQLALQRRQGRLSKGRATQLNLGVDLDAAVVPIMLQEVQTPWKLAVLQAASTAWSQTAIWLTTCSLSTASSMMDHCTIWCSQMALWTLNFFSRPRVRLPNWSQVLPWRLARATKRWAKHSVSMA